jgi:dTMP kinase
MATKGRFISIEGGDGAGKSTQVRRLADQLRGMGIGVVVTREPGGSTGAEAIRQLLLSNDSTWGMRAEALLFAAGRADHVEQTILPALERGDWVVSDRYVDSSRAYQGDAGGLGDDHVMALHRLGGEILPDRTILLQVGHETGTARANGDGDGEDVDRILARGAVFHSGVERAFVRIGESDADRIRKVDAAGTVDEVHARVMDQLGDLLG